MMTRELPSRVIIEVKMGAGALRHDLCAESDAERDSWVDILVRYASGILESEPDLLEVAGIARLPAVVFRCTQYLEAKNAEEEEGNHRLSGSSTVIKGLRDRLNAGELALCCLTYL